MTRSGHAKARGRLLACGDDGSAWSESFFIEGEGLVNTQLGGRHGDEPDPITDPERAAPGAAGARGGGAAVPVLPDRSEGPRGAAALSRSSPTR